MVSVLFKEIIVLALSTPSFSASLAKRPGPRTVLPLSEGPQLFEKMSTSEGFTFSR